MCKRKQGAVIESVLGETKNWLVLTLMEMNYDLHFLIQQQQQKKSDNKRVMNLFLR